MLQYRSKLYNKPTVDIPKKQYNNALNYQLIKKAARNTTFSHMTLRDKFKVYQSLGYATVLILEHEEIDLKNPKNNRHNAGFTDEERGKMTELLDSGFTDSFRYIYPDKEGIYSWWSYRFNARKNNAGWRIDYFVVSQCLQDRLADAKIHTEITGSDHCPIELVIKDL